MIVDYSEADVCETRSCGHRAASGPGRAASERGQQPLPLHISLARVCLLGRPHNIIEALEKARALCDEGCKLCCVKDAVLVRIL
jgi:hypothetical protein